MKKTLFRGVLTLGLAAGLVVPTQAADTTQPAAKKSWTFMVFLNADNNLDRFGVEDVQEMETVGSNDDVNVIVQIDRAYGKPCTRLYINKGTGASTVLENMGEVDMGSVDTYVDFVKWGAEKYPADHYCVVMWNHGSGWDKKPGQEIKGISYDDDSGNHITTAQVTEAHDKVKAILGKNLDILAFDACLMQMVEVTYAIRNNVDMMLGSEDVEPGEGWAYTDSLIAMQAAAKTKNAAAFANGVVDSYIKSYQGGSQGTRDATQSWTYPAKTDAVVAAMDKVADVLTGKYIAETKTALSKVQKFYERSHIDLIHFLKLMQASVKGNDKAVFADAIKVVTEYIGHNGTTGGKMANAYGAAVYFPSAGWGFSQKYKDLAFAKASKWDEMLEAFYKATKSEEADLE